MVPAIIIAVIALCFGAFLRGAPYVPTHRRQIQAALDLLELAKDDVVLDLGSGDGAFLRAAASRGLRAYGYEINPLLWLISRMRCLGYKDRVTIFWRDFWLAAPPMETKGIFIFSSGPYMKRLARWLEEVAKQRKASLYIVSYGFAVPGRQPLKTREGLHLYRLDPM